MSNLRFTIPVLLCSLLLCSAVVAEDAPSMTERTAGDRRYLEYVPPNTGDDTLPLVVMLHGCTQSPKQFARSTEMNKVARRNRFVTVYPEQTGESQRFRCWNFYKQYHRTAESGDARYIRRVIQATLARYPIDENRIYMAGFSAGAAMSSQLAVTFPDLIAAIAVHSGMQYGVAEGAFEAMAAMDEGGPDPQTTGREAYVAMGERANPVPAIVIHGTEDEIVHPVNGRQSAEQVTQTLDLISDGVDDDYIDYDPESVVEDVTQGHPYTRHEYRYGDGRLAVVEYRIDGLSHAWSGGNPEGIYVDPDAPDASELIWNFFRRHRLNGVDVLSPPLPELELSVDPDLTLVGQPIKFGAIGDGTNHQELEYRWEFGDGQRKSGRTVTHVYSKPGTFRVRVSVSNHRNDSDSASRLVTVVEP